MLQSFRNVARGPVGKTIVAVIVVAFVFFGAESIVSITNNADPVEVNGQGISANQVQRQLRLRQEQLMQQLGENATPEILNAGFVRQSVVNNLINQELLRQATDELGFQVSNDQVSRDIVTTPAFQMNGQFDETTYRRLIAQNGYTPNTFRDQQSTELRMMQMQAGLMSSAFSLDTEVDRLALLQSQQRRVAVRSFSADDFTDDVTVSEGEIQSYYDANSDDFLSPEQVKVRYLRLSQTSLQDNVVVTDADIQDAYDSYVAEQGNNTHREIAHILFASNDDNEAAAQAALNRLQQGESFESLAAELSDDPISAQDGGYLGELAEGVYQDAFYQAAQSLTTVGQVSAPVTTDFGVHLIELTDYSEAQVEPLAQKRDELVQQIRRRKAADEFVLVENQLADEAFQADDLATVAEVFDVDVQTSDWIRRSGNEGIAAERGFSNAAFSAQVIDDGRISDVVRLSNGDLAVLQRDDYQAEQVRPLAEVSDDVRAILVEQKSQEMAQQAAEAELANIRANATLGNGWPEAQWVTRDSTDLSNGLAAFSFTLPKPSEGGLSAELRNSRNGIDVVAVLGVQQADVDPSQQAQLDDELAGQNGQLDYQSFFNGLRVAADIKVRGIAAQQ
ncbi:SurA N-terminal domain-containing protein [Saccharospirillum mangrovi]|uniref:SurA N-terminal domain-containing protein n=1 Tax=Saccharospirillum mangrovi TaxID=2161747 RepID=UPI000D368D2A|nr:SurA N-terminal domain-containing protein [Saccharospirillum mangrovi]